VERTHARFALNEIAHARIPYDAVQLNSPAAVPLAREHGISAVYTIHHKREEKLSTLYAEHSEMHYVAISRRQLELETPLARASVIHHGVDIEAYSPSLHDDGYVLHLGRFAEEKGTHLAIDAAVKAHVPLALAGRVHSNDVDQNYFKRELRPRLERQKVIDVGEADHPRKVALLRGARALLCPVLWEEPFGLIAIEAMVAGTPVIAFPRGSFPEIIDHGVTGMIVSDVQEMAYAIQQARHWDRKKCMKVARERFSSARMARDYERVFEARLRQSGPYPMGAEKSARLTRMSG
jgi:glycosyltransferase involved in cell wall biosynthesis